MEEVWQLYGEDGNPLKGQGGSKAEVRTGLLHGASHVWIFRRNEQTVEVLVQKRAVDKKTWPGCLDISAAGHIDLGETPLEAAVRETKEEIGLDISAEQLKPVGVYRTKMVTDTGIIENEFQFMYILEIGTDDKFQLQASEVASVIWENFDDFQNEVSKSEHRYVPHTKRYFGIVVKGINDVLEQVA
ncbi:MAG: NUDIX domain-containing protein [Candidatus Saccharimonadales bacterium]